MGRICLIGEADPFIARLLQRFAAESGLQALRADDGEGVLELVRRYSPTVIILEPELPGTVRGWEAAEILANDPTLCHIPVIMFTSSRKEEDVVASYKHGAASFITKPVTFDKLLDTIRTLDLYWSLSELP